MNEDISPPLSQSSQNEDGDLETELIRWKCLNCQFLYEGPSQEGLLICPRCGNQHPDKFADVD